MTRFVWLAALVLLLLAPNARAQNMPIYQSGPVTRGHALAGVQNGVAQDAGGAQSGKLSEIGIVNTGLPNCITDVPSSSPTGYHQLCIGANATVGESSPPSGGGSGAFVGPSVSTVGDLVVFANISGNLGRDGGPGNISCALGPYTADGFCLSNTIGPSTANQIYRMTTSALVSDFDGNRSVGQVSPGTSVTNVAQYAAYQVNDNALGSGANASAGVLFFGVGVAAVNGSSEWGFNSVLTDNTTYAASIGTGRILNGNELDFNVTSPNTVVEGMFLAGASLSQPTLAEGFSCNSLGPGIKWSNCFISSPGVSTHAMLVGQTAASGANLGSQDIDFYGTNAGSTTISYQEALNTFGFMEYKAVVGGAPAIWQFDGTVITPNSASITNAFQAGAEATSGTSVSSQVGLFAYFDASGNPQAYAEQVVGNVLTFYSSAGVAPAAFSFEGSSFTISNLATQAHAGGNACLGYNATTKAIYVSSTVTTC